jgi:hypothetical protein
MDIESLLLVLRRFASGDERKRIGVAGARIVNDTLSWNAIDRRRANDYSMASKQTRCEQHASDSTPIGYGASKT